MAIVLLFTKGLDMFFPAIAGHIVRKAVKSNRASVTMCDKWIEDMDQLYSLTTNDASSTCGCVLGDCAVIYSEGNPFRTQDSRTDKTIVIKAMPV